MYDMNMKRLSLSALIVTGLVIGGLPTNAHANVSLGRIGSAVMLPLILITYRLETKESVKDPVDTYTWSDLSDALQARDFKKAWAAFDERFIGQKKKGKAIKLTEGDKEIKSTSATPATGVCGIAQAELLGFGKSALETTKVLATPALLIGFCTGALELQVKDGEIKFNIDPKVLVSLGLGSAKPKIAAAA